MRFLVKADELEDGDTVKYEGKVYTCIYDEETQKFILCGDKQTIDTFEDMVVELLDDNMYLKATPDFKDE